MSQKRWRKIDGTKKDEGRKPARPPKSDALRQLHGSVKPNSTKYGLPVLKNLAIATVLSGIALAFATHSDRIAAVARYALPIAKHAETDGGAATVAGKNIPIRSTPKLNSKVLDRGVWGDRVEVVSRDGKWARIRSGKQNIDGWVNLSDLKF